MHEKLLAGQVSLPRGNKCKVNNKWAKNKKEVKVIWQKAPHGGPIPLLLVTQGVEICTIEFLG